jgi:hypothetical protein
MNAGLGERMGTQVKNYPKFISLAALAIGGALAVPAAMAGTLTMTFNDDLSGTTAGSATVSIQDIGVDEVQVTLTPNFSSTSLQTITGLWLNDPGLTSVTVSPVSPTPNPYVSSTYATTQTTTPNGSLAGQYDSYIKFNNGSGAVIRGTTAETFDLTGTGGTFSAASFNLTDAPTGGSPANLYGLIGLTNYLGTAGSGVGYIAANSDTYSAVPLPAAAWLFLSGLVGIGVVARKMVTPQI